MAGVREAFREWRQGFLWGESRHELFTLARHAAQARALQAMRDEIHVPSDPRRIQYLQEVKAKICAPSGTKRVSNTEKSLIEELRAFGVSPEGAIETKAEASPTASRPSIGAE